MNCIGYCRVSTDKQTNDTQIDQIQKYAEIHKIEILGIYEDQISGAKATRPELDKLLQRIRKERIDIIITAYLSRLGRSQSHLIQILEEMNNKGIRFISINDGIDTGTPTGRLLYGILSALAEHEGELIRERTQARLNRMKIQGIKLGRKIKFDPDTPEGKARITRIRNLIRADPTISLRTLEDTTGIGKSTIHNFIKTDPDLRGSWKGGKL